MSHELLLGIVIGLCIPLAALIASFLIFSWQWLHSVQGIEAMRDLHRRREGMP